MQLSCPAPACPAARGPTFLVSDSADTFPNPESSSDLGRVLFSSTSLNLAPRGFFLLFFQEIVTAVRISYLGVESLISPVEIWNAKIQSYTRRFGGM